MKVKTPLKRGNSHSGNEYNSSQETETNNHGILRFRKLIKEPLFIEITSPKEVTINIQHHHHTTHTFVYVTEDVSTLPPREPSDESKKPSHVKPFVLNITRHVKWEVRSLTVNTYSQRVRDIYHSRQITRYVQLENRSVTKNVRFP